MDLVSTREQREAGKKNCASQIFTTPTGMTEPAHASDDRVAAQGAGTESSRRAEATGPGQCPGSDVPPKG